MELMPQVKVTRRYHLLRAPEKQQHDTCLHMIATAGDTTTFGMLYLIDDGYIKVGVADPQSTRQSADGKSTVYPYCHALLLLQPRSGASGGDGVKAPARRATGWWRHGVVQCSPRRVTQRHYRRSARNGVKRCSPQTTDRRPSAVGSAAAPDRRPGEAGGRLRRAMMGFAGLNPSYKYYKYLTTNT